MSDRLRLPVKTALPELGFLPSSNPIIGAIPAAKDKQIFLHKFYIGLFLYSLIFSKLATSLENNLINF
ncbi:hypothetical protein OB13_04680 [Pontibacter sp. HJ8]